MEAYLLKASAILALFLLVYQALLRRETFFRVNRFFLLSGIFSALLLPLVVIREEVALPMQALSGQAVPPALPEDGTPGWESLFMGAYLLGAFIFLLLLGRQLWSLLRLLRSPGKIRQGGYILLPGTRSASPFSFFRYIFYNPQAHGEAELQQVLEHEKAHARQWHSLDVLLARITTIVLWLNPLAWIYQKTIQENLEFLADAEAAREAPSLREYQYALLKVSGNPLVPPLGNPFNQSLIKKRIIMLQSNPSKSVHLVKYLLILPMLALFLMAFNRETVYVMAEPPAALTMPAGEQVVELMIDKNTTDGQLLKMKEDLAKDEIDFSYTTVRNEAGEIIDISLNLTGTDKNGTSFSGSYNSDSGDAIKSIAIRITEGGGIFIGQASGLGEIGQGQGFSSGASTSDKMVYVFRTHEEDGDELLEVKKVGGKQVIRINGETVDKGELRQQGKAKKIFVNMLEVGDSMETGVTEVRIENIHVEEDGMEERIIGVYPDGKDSLRFKTIVIDAEKSGDILPQEESSKMSFYSRENSPLIFIDGKKAGKKEMNRIKPDQIESINVLKGEKAIEKHGKKAKNGIIEITTKKE